jgi:hypothetical protein
MISFIKRHPRLLNFCISFLTVVSVFLLTKLNWTMLQLIHLKGKNPNPAPPSAPTPTPPEPKRKTFKFHYVPSWVKASFKQPQKHPFYGGVPLEPSPFLSVFQPAVVSDGYIPSVQPELSPTITSQEMKHED